MRNRSIVVCGIIVISLFFINSAFAIPTFARKYRTSCTTCHIGFQKLNPFGETFRQNGYQIPAGDAAYVKEEPVKLGADAWKKVWPKQVWPGTIPLQVPISFYAHQRIFFTENTYPTTNFKFPHEFKVFTAGTLGSNFSFWGEYNLQSSTLNRIFAQFDDMFLKESWGRFGFLPEDALNLRVGRLDVGAIGFPINIRRTITKPLPYTYTVVDGWDLSDLQSGFEANGVIRGRFKYALGFVNGTGGGTPAGVEDENEEKDLYYRISYKRGGLSFDGKEWGREETLKEADNWVDNAITVGQFGYFGTSSLGTGVRSWENDFHRLGLDLRLNFGNLDLYGAYVRGADKAPATTVGGTTRGNIGGVDTDSWFIEADYVFYPWLSGAFGYEQATYDKAFSRDIDAVYSSLLIWPRANIRLTFEGRVVPENKDGNSQFLSDLTYVF